MSSDLKQDVFGEEGRKRIKQLIESFSKKISSVGSLEQEPEIIRDVCDREEEKDSVKTDIQDSSEFQKLMFKNAKEKNNDFIVAEKKKW